MLNKRSCRLLQWDRWSPENGTSEKCRNNKYARSAIRGLSWGSGNGEWCFRSRLCSSHRSACHDCMGLSRATRNARIGLRDYGNVCVNDKCCCYYLVGCRSHQGVTRQASLFRHASSIYIRRQSPRKGLAFKNKRGDRFSPAAALIPELLQNPKVLEAPASGGGCEDVPHVFTHLLSL